MRTPVLKLLAIELSCLFAATACATLPDTEALIARHAGQAAQFENASGPLSTQKSAAVLAGLKRQSGDIDILDKQLALEQSIVGSPLILGNKVTLLQDGAAIYAAMFAAIRQARDHINLESYIFDDDEVGHQFADLLVLQQQRGIQVNVIHDSVGGINTPPAFFARLSAAGISVLEFNPVNPLLARGAWRINHRDHRKLLIIDGRTAFIGGINISSVNSLGSVLKRTGSAASKAPEKKAGNMARTGPGVGTGTGGGAGTGAAAGTAGNPAPAWRDTDLQIEGPVVGELQKLFLDTWEKQRGKPLPAKDYFPPLKAQGKDIVRAIGSTPDDPYSLIYLTLISAIGNAERQVHLTNAYFIPDPQLLQSLIDAAGRGVDVKLILPSHSDSNATFHAGRSHYSALLKAGVKIYQRRGALLHAKTASIDGVWSCVGSSNLDWRSFMDNDEVNAVVLGREFAGQMDAMFAQDLAASERIDQQSWERRPQLQRIKEWGARLLQRLL